MTTPEKTPERAIIHAEADVGSSIFDLRTENCDAIQLLGLAEALHAHGMAALAADMQQSATVARRSAIEVVRGAIGRN
jgi:hypothetical protein